MRLRSRSILLPALAVTLAGSGWLGAAEPTAASGTHTHARHKKAATAATSHHSHSSAGKHAKAGSAAQRSSPVQVRLAHMQMAPDRVEQIQQALIGAGALRGTPSGRWDSETRDAMSRYQAENGFGVTGLPDAKSLMKLGLGPHPLPQSLNPSRAAVGRPSAEDDPPSTPESAAPSDAAADPPSSSGSPDPQ